ncbi:MucR family transcriptional regulator [Sphingobium sp.]|uniref:MucR family transcriptional regulator n=1 Tax=Sphingobium sp. TaxID=1912891 RepID=UPI0035C67EBB
MADENQNDITALTVQLLSAYVSRNSVSSESLADLIKTTRRALTEDADPASQAPAPETFTPAVSVRKSLASPNHILSLIDGTPYKTLKRHLAAHGLTPDQYRERYNLPPSYPLVALSYSQTRRAVAERVGLGKKPAAAPAKPPKRAAAPAPTAIKADAATAPAIADDAKKPAKAKGQGAAAAKSAPVISNRANRPTTNAKAARTAPSRAKPAAKPKSLKAALEAASSHLGGDDKAKKVTTAQS